MYFDFSCHLLSYKRSLLIHVDFNALTKAFRFIIFSSPSIYFLITAVFFLFLFFLGGGGRFLFDMKSSRVLFIVSYILTSGFGKDVKSRLNIGMTRVLMTVIFPIRD